MLGKRLISKMSVGLIFKKVHEMRFAIPVTILLCGILCCHPHMPIIISGTVVDVEGVPPDYAYVALLSSQDYSLAGNPALTDANGNYHLETLGGYEYILIALPFSGEVAGGYNLHGYVPQMVRLKVQRKDMTRDFTLIPCHEFIAEGYDSDGILVPDNEWAGLRFIEDTAGNATQDLFFTINKGDETSEVTEACIPLGQTRRLFVQWTIPDFGNVVLAADNAGAGYTADNQGGTVLNLNYELARTQVRRLQANLNDYQAAGYDLPPDSAVELAEAEALLAQAALENGAEQAALSDQATGVALWALEALEQTRAGQDIPVYRMGDLNVTVLDEAGSPLPGVTVLYTQTSHDFLFGIFDTMDNAGSEGYELMQEAGVNYVTAGLYWNETEPKQDRISWEYIDHGIGVIDLDEMDFILKAHALMAFWDFATPDYLKAMSFGEFNSEVYQHISALVSRYRNQIDNWNVINEAHSRYSALGFSRPEITTLTKTGIRAIREHDPDARIIINNAFDWYGETRLMTSLITGEVDNFTLSVPGYLDQLAADGVDYEIIGQQLYDGGYVSLFADWGIGDPWGVPSRDMAHISEILDRLGKYGKPVHITEQSVPSSWDPGWVEYGAGWWHRPWDEEIQAEFLKDFYTIAFSKENVEAVTWWNINDINSFIFTGGLLDAENNPKPAYFALRDLISKWTSSGELYTDGEGQLIIRGFGGEYELAITRNGKTRYETVHIWEQEEEELIIRIGNESAGIE